MGLPVATHNCTKRYYEILGYKIIVYAAQRTE